MGAVVALGLAAGLVAAGGEPASPVGPARVIDGDTIDVAGVRVRLHGIDAPERAQTCRADGRAWPCGRQAARALVGC